jgi:hypothetical protein
VAIVSMEQALVADGETVPAGSGDFARRPMRLGPAPAPDATPQAAPTPSATVPPVHTVPTDPPPGR